MAVGDQAVRNALSTLSGLVCAVVNPMGQGNFTFRKTSRKIREFQKPLVVATLSNFLCGQLCCFVRHSVSNDLR